MYGPHKETTLVEFPDATGHILRGILTKPDKTTRGVLMLHGFERNASVEPKFKRLADHLSTMGVASLRLDYAGCGLSDGEFSHFTIASSVEVIASDGGAIAAPPDARAEITTLRGAVQTRAGKGPWGEAAVGQRLGRVG